MRDGRSTIGIPGLVPDAERVIWRGGGTSTVLRDIVHRCIPHAHWPNDDIRLLDQGLFSGPAVHVRALVCAHLVLIYSLQVVVERQRHAVGSVSDSTTRLSSIVFPNAFSSLPAKCATEKNHQLVCELSGGAYLAYPNTKFQSSDHRAREPV